MGSSSKHRQGVAGLAFYSELLRLGRLDWIDWGEERTAQIGGRRGRSDKRKHEMDLKCKPGCIHDFLGGKAQRGGL